MKDELVTVAGLYTKTSRNGTRFLFGRIGKLRVYLFPVTGRKPKDAKPDYRLCVHREDAERLLALLDSLGPEDRLVVVRHMGRGEPLVYVEGENDLTWEYLAEQAGSI